MRLAITMMFLLGGCAMSSVGCVEARDPFTPNEVEPSPRVTRVSPVTLTSAAVDPGAPVARSAAAPAPERVQLTQAAVDAAPAERPRVRLRETVSLGYAGDGPLTQIPPRDEVWYGDGVYGYPIGYGGYAYGYGGGYARGARLGAATTSQSAGGGGSLHFTPAITSRAGGGRPPMGGWTSGRPSGSPRGRR